MKFIFATLALVFAASAAHATGIESAIFMALQGAGMAAGTAATIATFATRFLVSAAFSLLSKAFQKKPKKPGLKTDFTTTGGTQPQSFILGRYATAGHMIYMNSHGKAGKTPNAYLTYVIGLSDIPNVSLSRVIVDGEYCTLGGTDHPDYGTPLTNLQNKRGGGLISGLFGGLGIGANDRAWIKFYDGTQTAADPMLVDKYNGDPERPWGTTAIGTDTAYAIMTFQLGRKVFSGFPKVRFELDGIPLYDIRKDDTAGGMGTHRWDDPTTWDQTDNPIVMIYNIARGITMPDGALYGGDVADVNLPVSNWVAAMNACDVEVGSPARPTYRAGYEVSVGPSDLGGDEPMEVIQELLTACGGQMTETGGMFRVRVGPPAASVLSITDDDIVVTNERQFDPFPGLESTYNGISYTHPSPDAVWEGREGEPIYNSTYETEDGGRRLIANLQLPACPYPEQASQLAKAYIDDQRRFRRHRIYLPAEYAVLEGLDSIQWTSEWNGYTNKVFEVVGGEYITRSQVIAIDIRERDSGDFAYDADFDFPGDDVSSDTVRPAYDAPGIPNIAPDTYITRDGSGVRVLLKVEWAETDAPVFDRYQIEGRRFSDLDGNETGDEYTVFGATDQPQFEIRDVQPGFWDVRIKTIFEPGNFSDYSERRAEVIGLTEKPSALENVALQTAGGLAVIKWTASSDLDVRLGGRILIRHSTATTPTWANSVSMDELSGSDAVAVLPLKPGKYLLRARDNSGLMGDTVTVTTKGSQALAFAPISNLQADPDWLGTKTNTEIDGTDLKLTDISLPGMYEFVSGFDFTTVKAVRLRSDIDVSALDLSSTIDDRTDKIDTWDDFDGGADADVDVIVEARYTDDDPSGTPTWTDWSRIDSTEIETRGVECRATLISNSSDYNVLLSQLRIYADEVA